MNKRFWQIEETEERAVIDIYGDITSWPWLNSDVSAYDIKQAINDIKAKNIDVFINSYGGEVAEALAIAAALNRHSAKVHTYCDGFACSAATIIFAAGDDRTMDPLSLLMIHNCMSYVGYANTEELLKAAEDNEKINQSSIKAYMRVVNVSEEEIKDLMNKETWLSAEEAVNIGLATGIAETEESEAVQQSARKAIRDKLLQKAKQEGDEPDDEPAPDPEEPDSDDNEIKELISAVKNLIDVLAEDVPDDEPDDEPETDPETDPEESNDDADEEEEGETCQYSKAAAFFNVLAK